MPSLKKNADVDAQKLYSNRYLVLVIYTLLANKFFSFEI